VLSSYVSPRRAPAVARASPFGEGRSSRRLVDDRAVKSCPDEAGSLLSMRCFRRGVLTCCGRVLAVGILSAGCRRLPKVALCRPSTGKVVRLGSSDVRFDQPGCRSGGLPLQVVVRRAVGLPSAGGIVRSSVGSRLTRTSRCEGVIPSCALCAGGEFARVPVRLATARAGVFLPCLGRVRSGPGVLLSVGGPVLFPSGVSLPGRRSDEPVLRLVTACAVGCPSACVCSPSSCGGRAVAACELTPRGVSS
jgi:hypothetical protein